MTDPDIFLELEDVRRKLATSNAILTYREACAETRLLDATEEQRKLRARLTILEPQYEKLYREYLEDEEYIEKVEGALKEAYASLQWHEDAVERYTVKNRGLQDKIQQNLVGEQKQQEAEAAALRASLEESFGEKKTLQEQVLRLQGEIEKAAVKKSAVESELAKREQDIQVYQTEIKSLREQCTEWEEKQRASTTERQLLQREVSTLRVDLENTQTALRHAGESANEKEEQSRNSKVQELANVRSALRKETKAREKAEKDLQKSKEDWEAKHKVLEAKLESTRNRLNNLKTTSATTAIAATSSTSTTRVPKTQNPKKRPSAAALTMADLESSTVKRPRKTPPKTSEFSITPFLKRTAAADSSTISVIPPAAAEAATAVATAEAEPETTMPAIINSKNPTKILLAGANRKRKTIPEEKVEKGEKGEKTKHKHKRKPSAAESSFIARPGATVFGEDDGSGRLVLDTLAEAQEPPVMPTGAGKGKGKKLLGMGMGTGIGDLLIPSVSAFNSEFSPPRKRPEGLKKLFGGKQT